MPTLIQRLNVSGSLPRATAVDGMVYASSTKILLVVALLIGYSSTS